MKLDTNLARFIGGAALLVFFALMVYYLTAGR